MLEGYLDWSRVVGLLVLIRGDRFDKGSYSS